MADLANLVAVITSDVSGLKKGFAEASASTRKLRDEFMESSKQFAAYSAAMTAAAAGAGIALYKSSADLVDQQAKLARAVGATTGGFQALAYSADLAGVNQEALAAASGKLNNKLGEAIAKGGESAKVFQQLGLDVNALANMDADQRFAAIADQIKTLGLDSTAAGAALKAMGLRGEEMRQFLMDGGEQIRAAAEELRAFGVVLSNVDSNRIEAANDAVSRIGLVMQGAGNQIAVAFSPYVEAAAIALADMAKESGGFRDEIKTAVDFAVSGAGAIANGFHLVGLGIDGVKVTIGAFGAGAITVFEQVATGAVTMYDSIADGANAVIKVSNDILGTQIELVQQQGESPLMNSIHLAAEVARDNVERLRNELYTTANAEYPSDKIKGFLNQISADASGAAASLSADRAGATSLGEAMGASDKKGKKNNSAGVIDSLKSETAAMEAELILRQNLAQVYRDADLGANASYFQQKMADISSAEQAETLRQEAEYQNKLANLQAAREADLARVAGDREAVAAVNAQYDEQEILAEAMKQQGITEEQDKAQRARERLRELERQKAIDAAFGLGSQLMTLTQNQSKTAFEISKKAALNSAVLEGYKSAVSAWRSGMETGGPWAPVVAASYAAASLAKTGALINSIRSASYGGGGSGGAASGGGSSSAVAAAQGAGGGGAAAAPGPQQVMTVQGLNPGDLFSGAMVQKIATGLLQFQKDGGKVVWGGQ